MSGCAWVTLATNDTYCLGALVLAHSLKRVLTRHHLAIIITPQVSSAMREQLSKVFDLIHTVDVLDSQDSANLALLQRPDLGVTFTKIHCWNLTQYSKCVFLDADTLVMQNCDELMEREEMSAAPDPGWPDCFNSGVFVFVPSQETFKQLIQFASTHGSFDGGDQGLLNMYFNDWPTSDIRKHLSFLYNMCSTSTYTYLPALKYYGANIKIVHFIGTNKPWLLGPSGAGMSTFTQGWWDIFQSSVVQHLSKEMSGLAGALGSKEKSAIEEQWRKQNWEQGNIDFTGKDSFENIWQTIMSAVNKPKAEAPKLTQQPETPQAPKEIASQAIPEKEKADIPTPPAGEAIVEQGKDAPIPVPKDVSTPKESAKAIPIPPPTPDKTETPKLPEPPKPETNILSAQPLEPTKAELPMLAELPKVPEVKALPLIDKAIIVAQPAAPQPALPQKDEAVIPQSLESDDLPKIEDILKGLEQTILLAELHSSPDSLIQDLNLVSQAPVEQIKDIAQVQAPITDKQVAASVEATKVDAPLAEVPKAEITKTEQALSKAPEVSAVQPQLPTAQTEALKSLGPEQPKAEAPKGDVLKPEAPKPVTPITEAPASVTPTTEAPAPVTPIAEAPKPTSPTTEVPKPVAPTAEAPKPVTPTTGAPKPETPTADAPKPATPTAVEPKPVTPIVEVPKSVTPTAEAPKAVTPTAETPKAVTPTAEAPKAVTPTAEAPKAVTPTAEAPKAVTPTAEAPMAVTPTAEAPKPVTPTAEGPKPATPTAEAPTPVTPATEAPKPSTPTTEALKSESQVTEAPKPEALPAQAPKPETPKVESVPEEPKGETPQVPIKEATPIPEIPKPGVDSKSETTESKAAAVPQDKKEPTPPKEQGKEEQKPGKQQAPQPPPKNGKHKKGQPEPTTAHPLAEILNQPELIKEQILPLSQDPLTPPISPESQTKDSEVPKEAGVQPGTPIVTAPTPPVTPLDASKIDDPLTVQIKSEEAELASGVSASGETPVPPKRKGKGNEKPLPQKPQNGGGKGKGKK